MIMIPLRIGTPEFMARLVRIPKIVGTPFPRHHLSMPQLTGKVLKQYQECVGTRLDLVSMNMLAYTITEDKDMLKDYKHRLSYDAESILWLLLYWAIQIRPKRGNKEDQIPGSLWVDLTSGDDKLDPRHRFVDRYPPVCHPDYERLDTLLNSLFQQLSGYQEYVSLPSEGYKVVSKDPDATEDTRKEDEYLHEAFQRTILAFIVENIEQPFMKAEISPIRRKKEKEVGVSQSRTTASVKRSLDEQGVVTGTRKKKKILREGTVTGNETVGGAGRQTRSGM
jgi:hypothetical protein